MILLFLLACGSQGPFTDRELDRLGELVWDGSLEQPEPLTNPVAFDERAVALGQCMWFDDRLSGPKRPAGSTSCEDQVEPSKVMCNHCHALDGGGADPRVEHPTSEGSWWTGRNATSVFNTGWRREWGWAGQSPTLWKQIRTPLDGAPHNAHPLELAYVVRDVYGAEFEVLFGALPSLPDPPPADRCETIALYEAMGPADQDRLQGVADDVARALAAYSRRLELHDSDFDRAMLGDPADLPAAAAEGARLFVDKGCDSCHSGPQLMDERYHNIGVSAVGLAHAEQDDDGFDGSGRFATPSLRNVELTGPYMHTGGITTLWDVMEHYRFGGQTDGFVGDKDRRMAPLRLDDEEIDHLVAFLETLTGRPPEPVLLEPDPTCP